jgi:serine/threonine-protein phosphatase 2A activator
MTKMYKAEVLGKLPVVQHFLFGSLLPYPVVEGAETDADEPTQEDEHGHVHLPRGQEGWQMDCCGIPGGVHVTVSVGGQSHARVADSVRGRLETVPSAFAAAAAEKSRSEKGAAGSSAIAGGGVGVAAEKGLLKPRSGLKPIPFD